VESAIDCVSLQGNESGTTAMIVAGVHGDEVTGILAAQRLDAWLTEHLRSGSVVIVPCANPDGLAASTRRVPQSGTDLNRSFPGCGKRAPIGGLADGLWRLVEKVKPDVLIDLHSDSSAAIPYAIVDRAVVCSGRARKEKDSKLLALARATGLTVLWEYGDDLYVRSGLDRSLAGSAVNQLGIPAVTIECGPRRRIDGPSVQLVVETVVGVLQWRGLVDGEPGKAHKSCVPGAWRRASAPRCRKGGLLLPLLAAGVEFEAKQPIARILSTLGEVRDEVRAEGRGVILSWPESGWLGPGSVVATIAVPEPDWGKGT